jgi:hypothetical protein
LEEKLHQVKIDEGSLQSFKESTEKVRNELEEAIIDMYAHLHMFQDIAATIIDQHSRVQTKLTQFNTIWEGMNNIDTWIAENPDAPVELYHPSGRERKIDLYSLEHCQQAGQREDKETTSSMEICSQLHKATQELIKICRLPS